jgi:NADH:ubiquinone oxidoreductase subunit 6 (subunit J)
LFFIMVSDPVLFAVLGVATVGLSIVAVWERNLIRAVVAFALSSAFLAGIFYLLASPYAAALELTVGAGLVAVLFLVAILLAGGEELEVPS